jgi:lipoprotein NlpD
MTRDGKIFSGWALTLAVAVAMVLSGCTSSPLQSRAPVEDRTAAARAAAMASAEPAKPLPGAENAGKPGYYTVKPGDTLIRIALESGQNWKDLVKWNNLENPNIVEVGQVVRVVPPGADATVASTRGVVAAKVETRPLDGKGVSGAAPATTATGNVAAAALPAGASVTGASASATAAAPVASASVPVPAPAPNNTEDNMTWGWPAAGSVSAGFEEGKTKGLSINGNAGDPVFAAAEGRVMYAGSGLRGYGNLIILKHSNAYLTAYAHNQTLLVKEDQTVRRGQKIAEMGASDADRVKLYFEIRKPGGKLVDPAKVLPPR